MTEKNKKIIIIDPVGKKAGMDNYNDGLAIALQKLGVNVFLASNYQGSEIKSKICFASFKHGSLSKIKNLLSGYIKAFKYLRKNEIDNIILHFFSYGIKDLIPVLMAKFYGRNVIGIFHDISSFNSKDLSFIRKQIIEKVNFIVVHNNFSKSELTKTLNNENILDKIHTIKHGGFLDLPDPGISKSIAREHLKLSENKKYLLFFGQIKKSKGLDILIEAFSKIKSENVELIIAGKVWHDDFSVYQKLIDKYNLSDKIQLNIRYISNEERELYLKAADLLVLPYKEIFQSGVLLMAMSFGLPVIASSLEANKEIIKNGINGFLFSDSYELSMMIDENIEDEVKLKSISANAIQNIKENFNWNTIANKYIDLLRL